MKLSKDGLELIKKSEGFRGRVYLDSAGLATIGYGHKLSSQESFPAGITEAAAIMLLSADVIHAEDAVGRLVKVVLTQGQFDALTDFCFNLGAGRLASSTLLKLLNAGDHDAARQQLQLWDQAGGKVAKGLEIRRRAEFDLWADVKPKTIAPLVNETHELRV
jgi:lysozyme